jgi:serralysin
MTTYYVATNGSDSANGSAKSPWRTISKAMQANLKPGDDVVVKSGTYKESVVFSKDGSAAGYITLRSEVPGGAKIDPPGDDPGIHIRANYVGIDGFNVSGSSGSGITGKRVHHVKLTDNIVHDNVSNGIFLGQSDFLLIEGNVVYGNAAKGASSGIHLKGAYAVGGGGSDGGYRIIIRDNVAYENVTKYGARTDGNGISLDDFRNTQIPSLPSYKFKTLIEDNIVYSNYGAGIQLAWSDYATVRDNISVHNNTGPSGLWDGELQNMGSSNNTWTGNIAVTDSRSPAISNVSFSGDPANKNVTWSDNTTFNGTRGADSVYANAGNSTPNDAKNDLGVDPGLSLSEVKAMGARLTKGAATKAMAAAETVAAATDAETAIGEDPGAPVDGSAVNDRLIGDGGSNFLDGGDGSDLLRGRGGKDILVGGADDDIFAFRSIAEAGKGQQRDEIRDFSRSDGDKIDLSGMDANTKMSGNQAFSFIGGNGFSGKAGQLQYKNGVVAGDVNGDKAADFHIEIANDHWLRAGDFLL